jgi:hypothetical protein
MRVVLASFAAWLVGSAAATAMLWSRSGVIALKLLPAFAVILGLWLLVASPLALAASRRGRLSAIWIYVMAIVSAGLSAIFFFVVFAYPFMVCVPVGMLAAAVALHVLFEAIRE